MTNEKLPTIQEKYESFDEKSESSLGEIYLNESPTSGKKTNRLVAAIDFGTTYSGYAFAFENDYTGEEDPQKSIHANEWRSSTGVSTNNKTLTTVLFDPDGNFHTFGYDAENNYAEIVENEEKDHTKWYCFKRFKMKLHDQMKLKRGFELEDENGHIMPAKKIFSASIKFLKDDLRKTLEARNPGFGDPSLWVLTVPAIWDEPAKQFMRECAEEAGLGNNMILALEPESAAIYCKTLSNGSFVGSSDQDINNCFMPGGMYMVLDLGGGTVDTAVHGVRDDCSIKEIHKACGGAWGGITVDENFHEHIRKLFGDNVVPELKSKHPSEWHEFLKRFDERKKQVSYSKKRKVKIEVPRKLEIVSRTFGSVSDLTKYKTNLNISDENMKKFFQSPAEKIEHHVRDILAKFPKLQTIFMVGGFSESEYIQEYFREKFTERRIIVPLNARIAVLKGAVIIGFNELTRLENQKNGVKTLFEVQERICRWTYGVRVNTPFIEGKHLEKYSIFVDGEKKCANIFDVFVKEGESVALFDERTDKLESSHKEKNRRHIDIHFPVFAVKGDIPTYTTNERCKYLGEIVVKPPEGGWPEKNKYLVIMYFGNTEFSVKVLDETDSNRAPYISTFDFLV